MDGFKVCINPSIFADIHKEKAIALQDELNALKDKFN